MAGLATRALTSALSRLVRQGRLELTDAEGTTHRFGDGDPAWPDVAIRLGDARVARDIVRDPRLGAAEAFLDGRLVFDRGDVMQLATLAQGGAGGPKREVRLEDLSARARRRWTRMRQHANHRAAARANVAHHYDLDDRLYDRFLDPWRQYSCAYWTDDTPDLAAAQRAKIAHIAAKLDLRPEHRLLDIGCGWGGLAIALHRLSGAEVTGITLSQPQRDYATRWAEREGVADRVRFELIDYRDVAGQFDRIVSVGMFEHVGTPHYPEYFRRVARLLRGDGVALIHSIGRSDGPGLTDAFTRKYIFPGGYIPALSEVLPSVEAAGLIATDVEILRLHYARTLRAWYDACVAARAELEAVYDERFFRLWTFYLAGATAAFEHGGMMNFQLQLTRKVSTLPLTRDYMAEAERTYRKALETPSRG